MWWTPSYPNKSSLTRISAAELASAFSPNNRDPEARALSVLEQTDMRAKSNQLAGGPTDSECASLLATIRNIHAAGVTIVWIELVVHALLSVARRLVVMNFGQIIADGRPDEVMASAKVRSVYLGEDVLG